MWLRKNKFGNAAIEYIVLLALVIGSLWLMQKYLTRNMAGRWQGSGDAFGFGRQYSYQNTQQCEFDDEVNHWYNSVCSDDKCDCISSRATCGSPECVTYRNTNCIACKATCKIPGYCD